MSGPLGFRPGSREAITEEQTGQLLDTVEAQLARHRAALDAYLATLPIPPLRLTPHP